MTTKLLLKLSIIFVILLIGVFSFSEYYTAQPNFCGNTCHIMKKYYKSWEDSKHRTTKCVDCHYAPGEKSSIQAKMKGLSQVFSYLATHDKDVKKKAMIKDESCTTKECHPKEAFLEKSIKYTEKVSFVHKTHEDKKIEGQEMHCNTCHVHTEEEKHFSVPKKACYLCHFKNQKFNDGRGKCSICHVIPTKPLQKQLKPEDQPITHESLEKNGVDCKSCHYELIVGEGIIKGEQCLECHDKKETAEKLTDKKLMHEKHVAGQVTNCFSCHSPIKHEAIQFVDPIINNCANCHPDHHSLQKQLLLADMKYVKEKAPALMFEVKTNCVGCHIEDTHDKKGERLFKGNAESCVKCHTEKHREMLTEWKDKLKAEVADAEDIKKEADSLIKKVSKGKHKIPEEDMKKAVELFTQGQNYINIVAFGNGVHNYKFSIVLLDTAVNNFDEVIKILDR